MGMKNWLAKVGSFLLGIIVGVIGAVGGLIGLGLWGYKTLSINKVEELTKQNFSFFSAFLEQDAALKEMTIEQIISSVASIPNKTFDELALEYGIKYPEQTSFLIDALNDVKIGEISSSLDTVISNLKIGDVLGEPYNDFETYPPTYQGAAPLGVTPILWTLRNYTLVDISTKIMDEVKIGSLLGAPYDDFENTSPTPPENASSLMWALRGYTFNNISSNAVGEIKIANLLGDPYDDFENYPEDYQGQLPQGVDSMLWAVRSETIDTMSDNLLTKVSIGKILGEPYSDFETYPQDYEGDLPEGAEPLLWDLRNFTIKGETDGIGAYPDSLTVGDLKNVFGVSLPEFLDLEDSVPLQQLGEEIDNLYIYQIIDPPQPESDEITQNIINKIRFLRKDGSLLNPEENEEPSEEPQADWYRLSEINELMNKLPSALTTQDVLSNPDQSETDKLSKTIMQKIYDGNFKVTELSEKIPETLNQTYISEIIDEPSESDDYVAANIINTIRTLTYDDGEGGQVAYSLSEINELLKALPSNLTIKSLIQEPQGTGMANNILYKIWQTDATITDLSSELVQVFEDLTFADILQEPASPNTVTGRIITKLRSQNPQASGEHWKITEIEDAINTFTFGDLYPSTTEGILSLIDSDTPLDQVPAEMEREIQETTMKDLYDKGLINNQPHSSIEDYSIDQIIAFINDYLSG